LAGELWAQERFRDVAEGEGERHGEEIDDEFHECV
jgi:hypothetical protein